MKNNSKFITKEIRPGCYISTDSITTLRELERSVKIIENNNKNKMPLFDSVE